MAAGNEDHSFFFFEMLQGYVIVYINCAQMEPLSHPRVAPLLAAWPGTRRWFLGLAPLPHGQELRRSRASGQDTYSVLA